MNKLVIAAAFAAVASTTAQAADLPARTYTKAPPLVAQAYDWTGFYLGVNAGLGFGRDKTTTTSAVGIGETTRLSPFGALGGGQVGYNWQGGNFGLGNIVLGVEADIQGTGFKDDRTCGLAIAACTQAGGLQYSQKLDWFGTARGRVGFATGPVLSYFTGGFAYGNVKTGYSNALLGSSSFSQTRSGWTVGSGVEAALGGNWTGKIEYLYVDLGSVNNPGILPGAAGFASSSNIREHIFRVGLNYRLGGSGLVAPQPVANWGGWYVGGNAGGATARNPTSIGGIQNGAALPGPGKLFLSPDGYLGGAQIGYNWQAANWVYGLEADIQGSSQRDDKPCILCSALVQTVTQNQKMQWVGTVRGRVGYGIGSSLFYVTGGLAYGGVKTAVSLVNVGTATLSETRTGWTVGGGVETPFEFFGLFGKNWTSKTEYLYVDLGKSSVNLPINATSSLFVNSHAQEHIFRTGLNYHFNTPVVAKY
ncbi:outer membrane protein [Bradyrhizobium sp. 2TAF24]|uniref:outer membrane protein n=1 Tax=Bradyrhizobium sp. 2TAF24 TaxID=3233011 RepID=UPI003F92812A